MYAALSVTASETESFSESLRGSLKACFRFLSWDSWTWLLLSHVLIRSTLDFMAPVSDLPAASLFSPPIIVARPMSCIATEGGRPVLLLSAFSSFENERHSGPVSITFSLTTKPQLVQ